MKFLIINGPNLNLIGKREPTIYGKESLEQIISWVTKQVDTLKNDLQWFQSNSEGEIINKLHWAFESKIQWNNYKCWCIYSLLLCD